jgi:hypothetical protein
MCQPAGPWMTSVSGLEQRSESTTGLVQCNLLQPGCLPLGCCSAGARLPLHCRSAAAPLLLRCRCGVAGPGLGVIGGGAQQAHSRPSASVSGMQ